MCFSSSATQLQKEKGLGTVIVHLKAKKIILIRLGFEPRTLSVSKIRSLLRIRDDQLHHPTA